MQLTWLGHSSFKIKTRDDKVIYIDPYAGSYDEQADIILVSHDHYDHSDRNKLRQIMGENTIILTTREVASTVLGAKVLNYGQKETIGNIAIEGVPAYNPMKKFHPMGFGLGFIITAEHRSVYFAGDTDLIPEMKNIKVDIALLPVGGTYTMNVNEAAQAASIIKPQLAVPMHFGSIAGTIDDAELFKELVESKTSTKVVILKEGQEIGV